MLNKPAKLIEFSLVAHFCTKYNTLRENEVVLLSGLYWLSGMTVAEENPKPECGNQFSAQIMKAGGKFRQRCCALA
jgi:hypothetical protein